LNLLRNKNDEIIHHLNEYKDYYKQITLELNEVKERNIYLQNKKQTDKDKVNEIISQNRINIQNLKNVIINNQNIINSNNIKNEKQFQLHHNTTIPNTNINNNTQKITVQQKQEVVNVFNPKKKFQDKLKSFK
jgi:type II restriction/modification system DNA methylase subunit YeeA